MSGSAYPAPIATLPIFNNQEFNYASSYLTYTKGDARYLQLTNGMTLNTNQSVTGQKTFSSIQTFTTTNGIPGGQAFNVKSLFGRYQTRLYSVNDTYSTDLYYPKFNGIDTLVSTASTATLTNKTLSNTILSGIFYANTQNTSAIGTQTNYISMFDNPIFLRGQNSGADANHYLVYGNVSGNSFAGQSTDGPALVGFGGGILGSSNGNWNLKWNNSSQLFTDTSNAGGTPWTVPRYNFNGYADTGVYLSTNGSTYKTVGTVISGNYISYTGINLSNGSVILMLLMLILLTWEVLTLHLELALATLK